jgi:hypothetical protein
MLIKNVDRRDCAHQVSDGGKDSTGIELQAIHVTF